MIEPKGVSKAEPLATEFDSDLRKRSEIKQKISKSLNSNFATALEGIICQHETPFSSCCRGYVVIVVGRHRSKSW